MRELGIAFTEGWPALSLGLHALAVVFRLPVVWIKARMRDLTQEAASRGTPLPARYHRLLRVWFAFGFPGFARHS